MVYYGNQMMFQYLKKITWNKMHNALKIYVHI